MQGKGLFEGKDSLQGKDMKKDYAYVTSFL